MAEQNKTATPRTRKADASSSEAMVTQEELGKTVIRNDVVAKIAGLAVREVDGVYRLVPFGTGQQVASLAKTVTGTDMRDLGVHVEVGEKEAAVDVRVITHYGMSIPKIAAAIRANVADRIESMTGLKVVEVNVDVIDLYFGEDEAEAEPETPRVH